MHIFVRCGGGMRRWQNLQCAAVADLVIKHQGSQDLTTYCLQNSGLAKGSAAPLLVLVASFESTGNEGAMLTNVFAHVSHISTEIWSV